MANKSYIKEKQYLKNLDLNYICEKMCSEYYPMPRWQHDLAQTCQELYKRFLWLMVIHPNTPIVPTRDIDEFWHNHILYTENYTKDCNALFGRYIHHVPSDPNNSAEMSVITNRFMITKALYLEEFREPLKILLKTE